MQAILRQATEAEARERDGATYREWGLKLNPEQYLGREGRLRQTPFARGALDTWLLLGDDAEAPSSAGDGQARILASCESYAGPSVIKTAQGDRVEGTSYSLASVFVDPSLRTRGYATEMMRQLVLLLRSDQAPHGPAQSLALFSDIGDRAYGRLGFVVVLARTRVWNPHDPGAQAGTLDTGLTPPPTAAWFLQLEDVEPTIAHISDDPVAQRGQIRLLVTPPRIHWHLERAAWYARSLGRRYPHVVGARQGNAAVLFAPDYTKDRLCLLAIRPSNETDTWAVLDAARLEALRMGVSRVEAWEPEALAGRLPGGELRMRRDELPMLLSCHPETHPTGWIDASRALWV